MHEPRIESDEPPPAYDVTCPENATDAAACVLDQFTFDGWKAYAVECQQCHGGGGMGTTFAPDLMVRINETGVDYGRFLYVMEHGYNGQMGVMPSLAKNPRVQKNKAAISPISRPAPTACCRTDAHPNPDVAWIRLRPAERSRQATAAPSHVQAIGLAVPHQTAGRRPRECVPMISVGVSAYSPNMRRRVATAASLSTSKGLTRAGS